MTLEATFDFGPGSLSYSWYKDGVPIGHERGRTLTFSSVRFSDTGTYIVYVTNEGGTTKSTPSKLTIIPLPSRFSNFSVLAEGVGPLVVGFVAGAGNGQDLAAKTTFLTRAAGPSLVQFGVPDTLEDPRLSIMSGGRVVAQNDNWLGEAALASAIAAAGAFPFDPSSKDAAVLLPLPLSSYTIEAFRPEDLDRSVLVELFDLSSKTTSSKPYLVNLSTLTTLSDSNVPMTVGFTVRGGTTPLTVLIRAIGPALSAFGLSGALEDPKLYIRKDSRVVATNDNWAEGDSAKIIAAAMAAGAFPLPSNSRYAAVLATLGGGSYTVELTSASNAAGIVLLEIYEVSNANN